MNHYTKTICFLLFAAWLLPMQLLGQNTNTLVLKNAQTGKDTLINDVTFKKMTPYNRQLGVLVTVWLGENESVRSYTPDQVTEYVEDGVLYKSKALVVGGTKKQLLLPEVYQRDSIRIYQYMPDETQKLYYISIGDDSSLLLPMQDGKKRKDANAVRTYLESFPIAKDELVKDYIAKMKPTPGSFDSRYEVVTSGNPNTITRLRWGIQGGIGLGKFTEKNSFGENVSYDSELSSFVGVFLDIPISSGFSLHPEVNFHHYAFSYQSETTSSQQTKSYAAYNRNDISVPVLIRYTICNIRGKWLPYFQVGPKLDFSIKRDLDKLLLKSSKLTIDNEEETVKSWEDTSYEQDKFNIGLNAGVGVEWKILPKNSLFFDVRYIRDFSENKVGGCYLTLAFNL